MIDENYKIKWLIKCKGNGFLFNVGSRQKPPLGMNGTVCFHPSPWHVSLHVPAGHPVWSKTAGNSPIQISHRIECQSKNQPQPGSKSDRWSSSPTY